MKTEPEIILNGSEIDFRIADLRGAKIGKYLVLCFDGVQFKYFGTPDDTPFYRERWDDLCRLLNSKDKKESLWKEFWKNWSTEICSQYGLPPETKASDYRPIVSYKVSHTVAHHTAYLHAAIGLFEEFSDQIKLWSIKKMENSVFIVEVTTTGNRLILEAGENLPLIICNVALRGFKRKSS